MKRLPAFVLRVGAIGLVIGGLGAPALAQGKKKNYDNLAQKAHELRTTDELASALWSFLASCDNIESDFEKRQCRGLVAARREQVGQKTFLIAGDKLSFSATDFEGKKARVKLYSCLACSDAVNVEGKALYVVGKGAPTVFGGRVLGAVVHDGPTTFKNPAAAARWKADVVPRLRTEFVVRVPTEEQTWKQGGVEGFSLEILGYRVHDPCTGAIVAAKPKTQPLIRDNSACTGADLEALQKAAALAKAPKIKKPKGPILPKRLTPVDIQTSLKGATEAAQKCYAIYGVSGSARFRIHINNLGKIVELEQKGDFVDTPTGTCIERAVKKTEFPKSQKKSTTVNYPFVLR